jgi:hypothetical protein
VTITERLDPISYGLTAEELRRYRQESLTLSVAITDIGSGTSTYLKRSELLAILSKWMNHNHYPFDDRAVLRQALTNLGVLLDLEQIESIDAVLDTALGKHMKRLHSAVYNRDYGVFTDLEPDGDGDINKDGASVLLQTGRSDLDVYFLMTSLMDITCPVEKNPSPPMRRIIGIK